MRGGVRFAVAAPRGIELKEDILLIVLDNLIVVMRHHDRDRAVLLLGHGLALDARLDLAGHVFVDKRTHVLLRELLGLVEGELLVLGHVLDGEGGPLVDLEVQVAGVGAEGAGVDGGEVDLALVLLGDGLQGVGQLLALLSGRGEDVCQRKAGL